jgi:REP element-mobilizing transposase RayT
MYRGALQPGKYYHIYNRGNNRENLFIEERNYPYFLRLYARHVAPIADTYAYCLMRNHFHLFARMKTAEEMSDFYKKSDISKVPTRAFAAMFTAYTKAVNKAYRRTGRLFAEHFGRIEVTSETYFTHLIFYIHFNPQKHGYVDDFRDWPWSSFGAFLSSALSSVNRDFVLERFGGSERFQDFHLGMTDESLLRPLVQSDFG